LTLDPSYRLQISWNGKHFALYFRSLLDGVLPVADSVVELPYFTQRSTLHLPSGRVAVETYRLDSTELVDFLLRDEQMAIYGGDALWLLSLTRWLLSLYRDEFWFPEVLANGTIRLNLLLDGAETRKQGLTLEMAMPRSTVAACPSQNESPHQYWLDILHHLADAMGWALLLKPQMEVSSAPLERLPKPYQTLMTDLLSGRKNTFSERAFFDSRQANLTIKQRVSGLAFRLIPPEDRGDTWQIRPQLQSITNPAVYIDALQGWESPNTVPRELIPPSTSPRLHLLREFGRALRLFPVLGASLASTPPSPLVYSEAEMSHFLSTNAEVLRSYGYELLAPEGLATAQAPEASLRLLDGGRRGIDLNELLDFQWQLVVQDTLLDAEQLEAWREHPTALFFSRGKWLWLDPKKTMKLLRFIDKQPKRGTLLEAMQYASEMTSLKLQYEGNLAPLDSSHRFEELVEPSEFTGQLRDYQRKGYSWLAFMQNLGLGACLADDMGLGKTVQALALLCTLKEHGQLQPALLVCPTSVLGNWQREAARFASNLNVKIHHGERPKNRDDFDKSLAQCDLLLTSYALLTRDHKLFMGVSWRLVILDEAQQIKNPNSKVSKLAAKLETKGRLILTGTPVENRLQDLWTLFRFLQPELLGSKRRFQSRFAVPIEKRGDDTVKRQLRRVVGPFILRRTKMDPLIASELPPRVDTRVECSLTPEQAQIYEAEVREALKTVQSLEGFERKGAILRLLTRLKQLCDHPALLEAEPKWVPARSGKIHRLFEILKELSPDEGVLIFSQFTTMLKQLKIALTESLGEEVLLLDGSTPREKRDEMVDRFQSRIGPRIFCISLKAGGVGLNLTRASSVVHFDRWWNPAVEAQATDRAHRIGQTQTVQVFKFVTVATLEEQIARILLEKESLMKDLIEDGDGWLTELNDRELSDLLLPSSQTTKEPVS
jgi:superfamily II DNA or RNA helicase